MRKLKSCLTAGVFAFLFWAVGSELLHQIRAMDRGYRLPAARRSVIDVHAHRWYGMLPDTNRWAEVLLLSCVLAVLVWVACSLSGFELFRAGRISLLHCKPVLAFRKVKSKYWDYAGFVVILCWSGWAFFRNLYGVHQQAVGIRGVPPDCASGAILSGLFFIPAVCILCRRLRLRLQARLPGSTRSAAFRAACRSDSLHSSGGPSGRAQIRR